MSRTLVLIVSLTAFGAFREATAQTKQSFDGFKLVDRAGNVSKPVDYRDRYPMLGAYTVLHPKGNQMHYTGPRRELPNTIGGTVSSLMALCW